MELEIDFLPSRIPLQKACSYKYQFCTKVCASSGLAVSFLRLSDGSAKYKEKGPDVSYSDQYVEKNAIPNSSLQRTIY